LLLTDKADTLPVAEVVVFFGVFPEIKVVLAASVVGELVVNQVLLVVLERQTLVAVEAGVLRILHPQLPVGTAALALFSSPTTYKKGQKCSE
jgi:hypothetical protein